MPPKSRVRSKTVRTIKPVRKVERKVLRRPARPTPSVVLKPAPKPEGKQAGGEGDVGKGGAKGPATTPYIVVVGGAGDQGSGQAPGPGTLYMNPNVQAVIANPTDPVSGAPNGWAQFKIQLSCVVKNTGPIECVAGLAEFYVGSIFSSWNPDHLALGAGPVGKYARINLIGMAPFRIRAGGTVTVVCPKMWVPGSADRAKMGVVVQAYDFFTDRVTAPFDAQADRHVGRNDEAMDPLVN
jgi:hypothetical protein